MTVVIDGGRAEHAAFRPSDPDLNGHVVLDFDAFRWLEEDEPIIGHPRDPVSRVDVRSSSRHIRLGHNGVVLAESARLQAPFESSFPMVRFYLPREDVLVRLTPGTAHPTCAHKGHATHDDPTIGDTVLPNIAWSYQEPLSDATQVRGLISFYQEQLDLFVDDMPVPPTRTPWSAGFRA